MFILNDDDRYLLSIQHEPTQFLLFCEWYLGIRPLPKGLAFATSTQKRVLVLGSIRCGKTWHSMLRAMWKCWKTPHYKFLNTSISLDQASIMFREICDLRRANPKLGKFLDEKSIIKKTPGGYPRIEWPLTGASMDFRSIGYRAELLRGDEWDYINLDEGGYVDEEDTIRVLEGRTLGVRDAAAGVKREGKLIITTTPTTAPWLREWAERGFSPTKRHLTLTMNIKENIHLDQDEVQALIDEYPEELRDQELYGILPEISGGEFPTQYVQACEDEALNELIVKHADNLVPGWTYEATLGRAGTTVGWTRFEIPPEPEGLYILAGDPGTDNPPRRNSGTIGVLRVDTNPSQLCYFHWVKGDGSYLPFLSSYKSAMETYYPLFSGLDASGPMKALDELAFEQEGINVDSLNLQKFKESMINTLKIALQTKSLAYPFVKGIRQQLIRYRLPDKHIAQDIVCVLAMLAHLRRFVPDEKRSTTTEQVYRDRVRTRRPARRTGRR